MALQWALGSPEKVREAATAWSTAADHVGDAIDAVKAVPNWVAGGTWTGAAGEASWAEVSKVSGYLEQLRTALRDGQKQLNAAADEIQKAIDRAHTALYAGAALFVVSAIGVWFTFGVSAAGAAAATAVAEAEGAAILAALLTYLSTVFAEMATLSVALNAIAAVTINAGVVTLGTAISNGVQHKPWTVADIDNILIIGAGVNTATAGGSLVGTTGAGLGAAVPANAVIGGLSIGGATALDGQLVNGKPNWASVGINTVAGGLGGAIGTAAQAGTNTLLGSGNAAGTAAVNGAIEQELADFGITGATQIDGETFYDPVDALADSDGDIFFDANESPAATVNNISTLGQSVATQGTNAGVGTLVNIGAGGTNGAVASSNQPGGIVVNTGPFETF